MWRRSHGALKPCWQRGITARHGDIDALFVWAQPKKSGNERHQLRNIWQSDVRNPTACPFSF